MKSGKRPSSATKAASRQRLPWWWWYLRPYIFCAALWFGVCTSPVTAQYRNVTWSATDEFVRIAGQQVGTRETGQNRGAVEKYQRSAGIAYGSPYCYAGLYWCADSTFRKTGQRNPLLRTGLASLGRAHLDKQAKESAVPARVNLIFWQFPNSAFGHVDLGIETLQGGWIKCIGFNTGGGGSHRDGGGVNYVKRNINHPLAKMKLKQIIGLTI